MPNTVATFELLLDGQQSLPAQENQINYIELAYAGQTVTFDQHSGSPPHSNKLIMLETGTSPTKPLKLIELGANGVATVSEVIERGDTIVFHSTVWADSVLKQILGVREK